VGEPGAKGFIHQRQYNFFAKLKSWDSYVGSYLEWVIEEAKRCRTSGGIALELIESYTKEPISVELNKKKQNIRLSTSSRRTAYIAINPELVVSQVYTMPVPEEKRLSFTRFRLSSHKMSYETGRWSRIPAEERLCLCGLTQNETLVLLHCQITEYIHCSQPWAYSQPGVCCASTRRKKTELH
jgi:hypothetical protein